MVSEREPKVINSIKVCLFTCIQSRISTKSNEMGGEGRKRVGILVCLLPFLLCVSVKRLVKFDF